MQMNRLAEARTSQGVSVAAISRFLGITEEQVCSQENPSCDLRISELQGWHKALKIPISELVVDCGCELSAPVLDRARVVRLMKTAIAIREAEKVKSTLSQMLIEQVIEMMPELSSMLGPEK